MRRSASLICALHHLLLLLPLLFSGSPPQLAAAQPPSSARALDATLQDYAFRAAHRRPRTGTVFNATLPADLVGIAASALRLRSGSLRRRGLDGYFGFAVPAGVVAVQPYVERVVLVRHDLGNWSDRYYPVPGYTHLAPVLGLLVYDAVDLTAAGLPEQNIIVTGSPITVTFSDVRAVPPGGPAPRCAYFDLDGVPQFSDLLNATNNVCSTYRQGHFSIVVNSSAFPPAPAPAPAVPPGTIVPPIPPPAGGHGKAWKITGSVVGAAVAFGLLASLMVCLVRHKRHKKLEMMERNAEVGETFRMAQVGRTQAPVASVTRTQPVIETDYVAT